VYNKDEAKDKFSNIDLENLNSFRPHIKKIIKNVLKEDKSVVRPVEKNEETKVATEKNTVVENAAKVEEPENITKTTYSRKRNFKVETE
jgi:hypothetical protein